jgi:hypothetical protein
VQKAVDKLGAEGTPQHVIDAVFAPSGAIKAGSGAVLDEIKRRVSQPTWNSIRQAMWQHLIEKPEGMRNWGPMELSNRISRFLNSEAAQSLFSDAERATMRQFQQHYERLAPLPNTTNPSGTTTMAEKFGQRLSKVVGSNIGSHVGRALFGPVVGDVVGGVTGSFAGGKADALRIAREVEKTKELFLGKKSKHPDTSANYSRAAAVISHAAPAIGQGQRSRQ